MQRASVLQGISLKKRGSGREKERERESTWGRPSLYKNPITLFQKVLIHPKFYIMKDRVMQGQQS